MGFVLRIIVFTFGILSIILSFLNQATPFIIAFLSIIVEVCNWRADNYRGSAEDLHRKLDMQESFGWSISRNEMSDIVVQLSERERKESLATNNIEPYFASQNPVGAKKALENLQESSWFTKHLALRMSMLYSIATVLLTVGSIWLLVISIEMIQNLNTLSNIGRLATSILVVVFSLGLAKFAYGYYRYNIKASNTERSAQDLLRSTSLTETEAINLWHDYQIARRTSPVIPTWLWKNMRNHLNLSWETYRVDQSVSNKP
nr:hypothetical protein [Oscillochloris trichoides]